MKVRQCIQAVIFDEENKKFLLIKKFDPLLDKFTWRLVKGGIDSGETEVEAVKREVFEEVGLKSIGVVRKLHYYEYQLKNMKVAVSVHLVKASISEEVKLQGETEYESAIIDSVWLPKEEAVKQVYFDDEKKAITICYCGSK